jgi:hypothetical protein
MNGSKENTLKELRRAMTSAATKATIRLEAFKKTLICYQSSKDQGKQLGTCRKRLLEEIQSSTRMADTGLVHSLGNFRVCTTEPKVGRRIDRRRV